MDSAGGAEAPKAPPLNPPLKVVCFYCLLKHFEASLTNSVDPDQTAPIGSGSPLSASILMLNDKQQ